MSVQDGLEFDPARVRPRGQADTTLPPGIFDFNWDATKAAAADAAADVPGRGYERRQGEIAHVAAEFARQTGKRPDAYYMPVWGEPGGNVPLVDEDRLFRDIRRYREAGNPNAFADIGSDPGDFDKRLRERFRSEDADRERRMSKGGFLGNLAGGVAGAFTDPINILTLPIGGGGKTAAAQILRNGILSGGIELAETPLFIAERQYQERDWTAREMATNIGFAAVGGSAFDAAGKAIGKLPALDARLYDAAAPLRAQVDARFADADMVRAFREMVPDNAMTPDQAAALHVWTRAEDVRSSSPFRQTYDAIGAHEATLERVIRDFDAGVPAPALPVRAPAAPAASPALAPDFENAWNAIIGIEGGTNRDGSFRTSPAGAIGPAQVMPGTAPEAARLAGLPFDERRYRTDANYNIALGRAYYREMLRQFDGDPVKAAAAYNAGPGSAARGNGVRGAMARARKAGVPDDWVSFLPAETRGYVVNFRNRTGMAPGAAIDGGADIAAGPMMRDPALDAERTLAFPEREGEELAGDFPELRRDLFPDENSWRVAQAEYEAHELGLSQPEVTRQSIWADARDQLMAARGGEVPGALFHRDVGPIDVVWGDDTGGLAKIVAKHDEVLEDLPMLIESMDVIQQGANRIQLESRDHSAAVRLDRDGASQRWLLTAFERWESRARRMEGEGAVPSAADYRRAADFAGASPTAGTAFDIALARQGIKLGDGVGHPGYFWGDALDGGRPLKPVYAVVDRDGAVRHWETTANRARRQMEARGIEGDVQRVNPPTLEELATSPALRDELQAEGLIDTPPLDPATARRFDDPAGAEMRKLADGAWHDILAADDPDLRIDLGDSKGERSIAEIRSELDKDAADIDAIEACMRPGGMGGGV